MRKIIISLLLLVAVGVSAQVTTEPAIVQQGYTGQVKLIFNPNEGDKGMVGATECYLYSCVEVNGSGKWEYQLAAWPSKSDKTKMTKNGSNWEITIPNLYTFYGVPESMTITRLLLLFTDGKNDGKVGRGAGGADIILKLAPKGLSASIVSTLGEITTQGSSAVLNCYATQSASLKLKLNGEVVKTATGTEMTYNATFNTTGDYTFELEATDATKTAKATVFTCVAAIPTLRSRPAGINNGIYYDADPTKVTLCTYAGSKTQAAKHVFVVGDFNNWTISNEYQLKQAPDSAYFWIELENLTPKKEYAFQYVVVRADGVIKRICDVYSEKVLTGDDPYEPKTVDPSLKPYPSKGDGFVSVLQTNKDPYQWSDATLNFQRPDKNNLVIYELWIYDYTAKRTLQGVRERLDYIQQLGVNAIELMPVCEFDGNYNWGYSPALYFALDKAYATPKQFKEFVDDCHSRGIAVILDMVFNHATGNNPMNKLYPYGTDLANNPWFCTQVPHDDNVYEKWNHDFGPARDMFTRALRYWIEEYKVDGYRMDLSHGLCGCGSKTSYDYEKLMNNISHYYNNGVLAAAKQGGVYPNGEPYFILEHWGPNMDTQRPRLVNQGMLCWENVNEAYMQVAMGWMDKNDDLSRASKDGYVSYCESHDEERMQYKCKMYGNGAIKTDLATRINRVPACIALNVLLDGPHMLWQFEEIGFDFSINSDANHRFPGQEKEDYRCNIKARPEAEGYFSDPDRVEAYVKSAQAIQLRTRLRPEWFAGNPTSSTLGHAQKVRYVQWGSNVYVVANLDVKEQSATIPSGTWYDYFAGGTKSGSVTLQPGELLILTGSPVELPTINRDLESLLPIMNVQDGEASKAVKFLRNGQVLILRGDKVYTITGMEIR